MDFEDGKYYKVVSLPEKGGKGVVATRDMKAREVVFVEDLLHRQPVGFHPSVEKHPEYTNLMSTIQRMERSHHLSGGQDAQIRAEGTKAMDRLKELNSTAFMAESPNLNEIWKLEDARRDAKIGDTVMIDGLQSPAGKKLNEQVGKVQSIDETDPNRLGVAIERDNMDPLIKSIKRENLKSLGGIFHTNGYQSTDSSGHETSILGRVLCRINHACGDAANAYKQDTCGKVAVYTQRDIKAGEEILIDYLAGEKDEDKRDLLEAKFKFTCQCAKHRKSR